MERISSDFERGFARAVISSEGGLILGILLVEFFLIVFLGGAFLTAFLGTVAFLLTGFLLDTAVLVLATATEWAFFFVVELLAIYEIL